MTAKDYLLKIKELDKEIDNKQMEIDALYNLITRVTPTIKDVQIDPVFSADKTGDTIAKILDLKKELDEEIDRFVELKLQAIEKINKVEDVEQVNILIRRYINYEEFEEIGNELGYSRQTIAIKHGQALAKFQRVLT